MSAASIHAPTLGDFLHVLFGDCRGVLNLRAASNGRPGAASAFAALADKVAIASFLKFHRTENCWIGAATRQDESSGDLANCADLPALFVDLDGDVDGVSAADRLEAFALPPAIVVESSPGKRQAYWLLRGEPLDLQNPADQQQARSLLRRLAVTLAGDLSAAEPARVMRCPLTRNVKYTPPAPVTLLLVDAARTYNVSDFDERLQPEPPENGAANGEFAFDENTAPGGRNDQLFRLGRSLKQKKLAASAILAALQAANATFAEPHDAREVERVFDSAMRRPDRVRKAAPPPAEEGPDLERDPPAPPEPGPPPPLTLSDLLDALGEYYREFVVMSNDQQQLMALWTAHTHVFDAGETTPYLHVTGATKRCGKTLLLELAEAVVRRPWLTGRTTPAALPRKIHASQPTLLLDESDQALKAMLSDYSTHLIGVLNSGYRHTGVTSLCLGDDHKVADLKTYCPKAIAGIGQLPETIADRSVALRLRRRTREEHVSRARARVVRGAAKPLREALEAWRSEGCRQLKHAEPALPDALNDRQQDCWEPLFAIADLAGCHWPQRARAIACALVGGDRLDEEVGVQLLADIHELESTAVDGVLISTRLLRRLTQRTDRPWATFAYGKPLTALQLARLLSGFDIIPDRHWVPSMAKVLRGYRVVAFVDAWRRYGSPPPSPPAESVKSSTNPIKTGPNPQNQTRQYEGHLTDPKNEETPITTGVLADLTDFPRDQGGEAQPDVPVDFYNTLDEAPSSAPERSDLDSPAQPDSRSPTTTTTPEGADHGTTSKREFPKQVLPRG